MINKKEHVVPLSGQYWKFVNSQIYFGEQKLTLEEAHQISQYQKIDL